MNGVTTIGEHAFTGCTGLMSVKLPSVSTIGNYAFSGCSALPSITLPSSLTTIGTGAFTGCMSLLAIHCNCKVPPSSVFSMCDSDMYGKAALYVPKGFIKAYKGISPWDAFAIIIEE